MRREHYAFLALACIVAVSAFLRFHNLETNPGWDADEGYNINIARNLSQGRLQMYAMSFAFVQHPPLFYALLAPIFNVLGANIFALRLLASSYGVLTTFVLFFVARDLAGHRIAILSSTLFAIYPVAVVFNRLGYSYNQLMFFALLCFFFSWRFQAAQDPNRRRVWAVAAGLAAGLGSTTDQEGVFLILFVVLVVALGERKRLVEATASSLALPLAYAASMLALVPAEFIYDLQHNFGRVSGNGPLAEILILALSYERFLDFSYWLPLGIVGLFLLRGNRAKLMTVGFFFLMLLFILKIRNPNPFFRTAVPVLPFVALGMGLFVDAVIAHLFKWSGGVWREILGSRGERVQPLVSTIVTFALVVLPIAVVFATDVWGVQTRLPTSIDSFLANSPDKARMVAKFVNDRVQDDDVVIASSHISWLLRASAADLLQAVASEGKSTAFYPADLPRNRFAYDARALSAKFVVVDDFSRLWARRMPEERAVVDMVTSSWTKVYEDGEYQVFENPGAR